MLNQVQDSTNEWSSKFLSSTSFFKGNVMSTRKRICSTVTLAVAALVCLMLSATPTQAAVLGQYTLDTTNELTATSVTSNGLVSNLVINDQVEDPDGGGLAGLDPDTYQFGATSMYINRKHPSNWQPPNVTLQAPFEFKIRADANHQITVDSFTATAASSSGHLTAMYFGTSDTVDNYGPLVNFATGGETKTVSLSSSFVIAPGTTQSFYIDLNSDNVDSTHEFSNIDINGSVAEISGTTKNIVGLYATGVDDFGVPLADGVADPHYTFVSGPQAPSTNPQAMVQANNAAWDVNDGDSKWIGVVDSGGTSVDLGTYVYELAFELPSDADLGTVEISGDWWGDDGIAAATILLNGVDTLVAGNPAFKGQDGNAAIADGTAFTIVDGMNGASFVHGNNTLRFSIPNGGGSANPHGLRVANLSGTFSIVPEPTTFVLAALGLVGLVGTRRRRRR